ncbi:GNAT family acetyltransferase [Ceratobasidium sp. AG-Ba]|nr:GNAT family acetyltransferase [Ceratobasidium sp. AG-Ba]
MAPSRTEKTTKVQRVSLPIRQPKKSKPPPKREPEEGGTVKDLAEIANMKSTATLQKDLDKLLGTAPANKVGDATLVWKAYQGPELKSTPQKDNVWSLFETNMRDIYKEAKDPYLKWAPAKKKKELYDKKSRYILLEAEDHSELAAFCMFRFEAEPNYEGEMEFVMYIYEIQVAKAFQGAGICRRIFGALEQLSSRYEVQIIMLTVFKCKSLSPRF